MIRSIVFALFLLPNIILGQDPAHFVLGEKELSGVHVYSIHQDRSGIYWFATNNGLYKFDGYQFKQLSCETMLSNSLFNLIESEQGELYCNNLSGQIFSVTNDSISLYFQVPDSLMGSEINISTDNLGDVIVMTGSLFRIKKDKSVELIAEATTTQYTGQLFKRKNGALIFTDINNSTTHQLLDGNSTILWKFSTTILPRFLYEKSVLKAYDLLSGKEVFCKNAYFENIPTSQEDRRLIYATSNHIWDAKLTGGAYIKEIAQKKFESNMIFKSHVLSAMHEDQEGNILIGTFGEGILVIPNIYSQIYSLKTIDDKPTKLVTNHKNVLYIGSQLGNLYEFTPEKGINKLNYKNARSVECIGFLEHINGLILSDKMPQVVLIDSLNGYIKNTETNTTNLGAIKDVTTYNKETYLIGSNTGVYLFKPLDKNNKITKLLNFDGRTNSIGFDANNKLIYSGTSRGLRIGNTLDSDLFELDGAPIICKDILFCNKKIYVSAQEKGVLIFENGKLIDQWNLKSGLPSNSVNKLVVYKDRFILSADNGIFVVSRDGKVLRSIKKPEGIIKSQSNEIEVLGDYLFIAQSEGLLRINLEKLERQNFELCPNLIQIKINDSLLGDTSNLVLKHDENKITFILSLISLKYTSDIQYKYRLAGIDKDWQYNDYEQNTFEYKSLPAGDYVFEYSVVFRNQESQIKAFKFKIRTPYWQTWYFFFLLLILTIGVAYLIYRLQIKRQKKLNQIEKEVIASKLKAVQSQMNPHFIFNSLNSIQDLVLQQDGKNAYNYISKFAFLVRKILHFSEVDFIDLEEEIKVLDVYLELEKLRFHSGFEYIISSEVDDDVELPPMIVQPFVENAIKHGLLHKEGNKKLTIHFALQNEQLTCTVADNGIGREASKKIKQRKTAQHESFSVKSIENRFEIMRKIYGNHLGVDFEDLTPSGTKVMLKLPVKRKY